MGDHAITGSQQILEHVISGRLGIAQCPTKVPVSELSERGARCFHRQQICILGSFRLRKRSSRPLFGEFPDPDAVHRSFGFVAMAHLSSGLD
jgi:hypothetical protein